MKTKKLPRDRAVSPAEAAAIEATNNAAAVKALRSALQRMINHDNGCPSGVPSCTVVDGSKRLLSDTTPAKLAGRR